MTGRPGVVHLQTLVVVYRTGSLTRAADELGISQPAVTQRLQVLESATGPLFERHRRGVRPTRAADALAGRIAPAIETLEDVLETMVGASSA